MIESILIGAVIAVASIILIIVVISGIKSFKKGKKAEEDTTKIEEKAEEIKEKITEEEKKPMKIVIAQGESVVVGSEGTIACGEYTMESCDGEEKFNVRIGRYVKEYENGCTVVLTEKQKITPVSTSIILR